MTGTPQMQADALLADFRRDRSATPTHNASRLVFKARQGLLAAGFECGTIEYNHMDGRHAFPVMIDGRKHWITAEPDQADMRADAAATKPARTDWMPSFGKTFG